MILSKSFYLRDDVVTIARELIGKVLVTKFDGCITSGIITETEAYAGIRDKASHAYGGRNTRRTGIMYREGGVAYIYLCYGIHSLFNIVTNREGIPDAVLIRSILPVDGHSTMLARSQKKTIEPTIGVGPGKVANLLGIHYSDSGLPITSDDGNEGKITIWVEERGIAISDKAVRNTPRIGVDYAGEDALLPYRFILSQEIKMPL